MILAWYVFVPPVWLSALNNYVTAPTIDATVIPTDKLPSSDTTSRVEPITAPQSDLKRFADTVSVQEGLTTEVYQQFLATINGESSWNTFAVGDDGKSYGILQFTKPTFLENCTGNYYNAEDQIVCGIKMFKKGMMSRWTVWRNLYSKNMFREIIEEGEEIILDDDLKEEVKESTEEEF